MLKVVEIVIFKGSGPSYEVKNIFSDNSVNPEIKQSQTFMESLTTDFVQFS